MADSLTLQITADTSSLAAKLAQAQADVRAYGAEVRRLADELRSAGAAAKGGLEAELEQVAGKLARAQGAAAGFRNELRTHKAEIGGVRAALGGLGDTVKEVAGAFGIGFGAEQIVETVKQFAELGEHTVNAAAAVGYSTEQYSTMANAMALVGGDADLATRSLVNLQKKLEEALANPSSEARRAFLAMGLTLDQLKAGLNDVPGLQREMADGFVRMGEGRPAPGPLARSSRRAASPR